LQEKLNTTEVALQKLSGEKNELITQLSEHKQKCSSVYNELQEKRQELKNVNDQLQKCNIKLNKLEGDSVSLNHLKTVDECHDIVLVLKQSLQRLEDRKVFYI